MSDYRLIEVKQLLQIQAEATVGRALIKALNKRPETIEEVAVMFCNLQENLGEVLSNLIIEKAKHHAK